MRVTVEGLALRALPCVRRWDGGIRAAASDIGAKPYLSERCHQVQPAPHVLLTTGFAAVSFASVNTVPLWLVVVIV